MTDVKLIDITSKYLKMINYVQKNEGLNRIISVT